jgi:hypothetical protein
MQLKQIVLDVNELFEDSVVDLPVMSSVVSLFMNDNSVRYKIQITTIFSYFYNVLLCWAGWSVGTVSGGCPPTSIFRPNHASRCIKFPPCQ